MIKQNIVNFNLEEEIWKDIPDYEGIYQASNYGRIRTAPNKTTFTQRHGIRHWKSRIMSGRGNNLKTGKRVGLWKDGKVKDWLVARLVAITFLGKPTKEANTVNHKNGNRLDNRIENLEWLSIGDNVRHAFENDLIKTSYKIILFNNDCSLYFKSLSKASLSIGRNHGYISLCIKRNKTIKSNKNIIYDYKLN